MSRSWATIWSAFSFEVRISMNPVPASCKNRERYFLRLPAAFAGRFPDAEVLEKGEDSLRLLTQPVPVDEMHRLAAEIRNEGGRIAFAAFAEG